MMAAWVVIFFSELGQCMDVNARNYRWSESHSKVCQMCDMGEDETVEHVMLECEKYERERHEIMQLILSELGHNRDERVEKTGREWMVLLLGLCKGTSERIIEDVKEYLERMWQARSCRSKGLALEQSQNICSIKIKIIKLLAFVFC
ncbi:hypothetical protein E2C01_024860 [Portunus trituberculatus]|uniref:Reverse transcriptase zinc-binding domain-containing protein n=1 Tax=Portunus trituberculatus TaxID=210409 RepID=A0A5B7EEI1_PORTR|nr:hypothetical protein [Portunus trituberculatus]